MPTWHPLFVLNTCSKPPVGIRFCCWVIKENLEVSRKRDELQSRECRRPAFRWALLAVQGAAALPPVAWLPVLGGCTSASNHWGEKSCDVSSGTQVAFWQLSSQVFAESLPSPPHHGRLPPSRMHHRPPRPTYPRPFTTVTHHQHDTMAPMLMRSVCWPAGGAARRGEEGAPHTAGLLTCMPGWRQLSAAAVPSLHANLHNGVTHQ